jgi:hypothetical protein
MSAGLSVTAKRPSTAISRSDNITRSIEIPDWRAATTRLVSLGSLGAIRCSPILRLWNELSVNSAS